MGASLHHRRWRLLLAASLVCAGCVHPVTRPQSDAAQEMAMEKAGPPRLAPSLQIADPPRADLARVAAKTGGPTKVAGNAPFDAALVMASGQLPDVPPPAATVAVPPPPGARVGRTPASELEGRGGNVGNRDRVANADRTPASELEVPVPPSAPGSWPVPAPVDSRPLAVLPVARAAARGLVPEPRDPFPQSVHVTDIPAVPQGARIVPPTALPPVEDLPALAPRAVLAASPAPAVQVARLHSLPGQASTGPDRTQANAAAGNIADVYRLAAARIAGIDGYIVRVTRREQVAGKGQLEQVLLLKARKTPGSFYLKGMEGEGKGHEAVYVRGCFGDKVHIRPASGAQPGSAGKPLRVAPDSPLALAGRHPITDIGLGPLVERFGVLAAAVGRNELRGGSVKYLGFLKRFEFEQPVEAVLHTLAAGAEPGLPRGGQRWWYFDPAQHLPVLVITHDDTGREVEYACYDHLVLPAHGLPDGDFNPDVLWQK